MNAPLHEDQENAKIPDSFKKTFNRRSWYFAFRCFLLVIEFCHNITPHQSHKCHIGKLRRSHQLHIIQGLFSGIVGAIFEVVAMELYPPDDSLTSKTTIMHYFIMFFPMGVAGIIEVRSLIVLLIKRFLFSLMMLLPCLFFVCI